MAAAKKDQTEKVTLIKNTRHQGELHKAGEELEVSAQLKQEYLI